MNSPVAFLAGVLVTFATIGAYRVAGFAIRAYRRERRRAAARLT